MGAALETCGCISIAGLRVSLWSDEPRVTAWIKRHYALFIQTDENDNDLRIEINILPVEDVTVSDVPSLTLNGAQLHLSDTGLDGRIDLDLNQAHLTLARQQAGQRIDYFLRVIFALLVYRAGGLLLHTAAVARNNRTYLFFGSSGSGKTTVSRLSEGDVVLNDDLVVVMPQKDGWQAYSTPFWNPTQVQPTNTTAPVAALFRLVKDNRVYLEEMTQGQAVAEMISSVPVLSADPVNLPGVLARCERLLASVSIRRLHFLKDASFWPVVEAWTTPSTL